MAKFIVLFVFVLQTITISFVSFSQALQDDGTLQKGGSLPSTVCGFAGASRSDTTFKFSKDVIPLIPERCGVICYGYFRINNATNPTDIENIKLLTSEGYTVWTFVSYVEIPPSWDVLMDASPADDYEKQMEAISCYINDNQISGIILDMLILWDSEKTDFACKANGFICKLKERCPNVLVGVAVSAMFFSNFSQDTYYDFGVANEGVDFYFVDTLTAGVDSCSPNSSSLHNLPLTEQDTGGVKDIITLDTLDSAVRSSKMDPSKIILNLMLQTRTYTGYSSYADYCCEAKATSSCWCADPLSQCYKEGAAAKSLKYVGISITYLDFDDYKESCGCGNYFPVTNAFIDGFESANEPCCTAIDTPRSESGGNETQNAP